VTSLPGLLWVEGDGVRGVAFAMARDDTGRHLFVMFADNGTVAEVNTNNATQVRPYFGDVYTPYLIGRAAGK
jgi:hypothetical protein